MNVKTSLTLVASRLESGKAIRIPPGEWIFALYLGCLLPDSQFEIWRIGIFCAAIPLFAAPPADWDGVWTMTDK